MKPTNPCNDAAPYFLIRMGKPKTMNSYAKFALPAIMLSLVACGNPQKAADTTLEKAQFSLQDASGTLDPEKRVKAYNAIIKDVESIAKKYPKTAIGEAIAAGRSANGVSVSELTRRRDELAERATCYTNPTVECLTPFGSGGTSAASTEASKSVFARAEQLVCNKGFPAADKALDAIKINKEAYSKQLIQVGFAAAQCDKPDAVKAAITAYMTGEPAQGQQRVQSLLSILGTKEFNVAYPMIIAELEQRLQSGAISGQDAANVTLTLAVDFAKNGDAKAAMAKYNYFTDTLHYQADSTSLEELATNLMADGDVEHGRSLIEYADNQDVITPKIRQGAVVLAARMGLVGDSISGSAKVDSSTDFETYIAPMDGVMKAQYETGAQAIEAGIDKLAASVHASQQTVGDVGLDTGYTLLALVQQKLGESDKAKALIGKADAYRSRMLDQQTSSIPRTSAEYRTLLALAQGDLVAAANYVATAGLSSDSYGRMLMNEVGRTQDPEGAISLANMIGNRRDLWHCYSDIVPAMAQAGKGDEVEKLIAAYPGQDHDKEAFYWMLVDGMVARGDVSGAKNYARKHDLVKDDDGVYNLNTRLMTSEKIAANRGKAEPIIREIFTMGEARDTAANVSGEYDNSYSRGQSYQAESAADMAFKNGYTDLGIELYQKATYKDHRPLLSAFADKISKGDMTKVLMLAQDNATSSQYLGYVVDAAIHHLEKNAG